jgi:NAD(P)-dependent dehydrogenase (short-subunit alcohol dehydrogenase family)
MSSVFQSLEKRNKNLMNITGKTILITGTNRGLGQALVEEALRRGAKQVYAGARVPASYSDERVTPLTLDITNAAHIQEAVEKVKNLDILINNASIARSFDVSDRAAIQEHLAVIFFGTYDMTQAFLPLLTHSRGAIVNVLSLAALAALPIVPPYSIAKAAAFNLTQSLRALLAGQGVSVHAVLPGPIDTEMSRSLNAPKASPASVARAFFDGLEKGEEDIFPDPTSESLAESWRSGAIKELERQSATLVATS